MSSLEVVIDNAKMTANCFDEAPVPEWVCFDLSTAIFFSSGEDSDYEGQYNSGTDRIQSKLDSSSFSRNAQFHFPGFTLDATKTYDFRFTYAAGAYGAGIYQQNPAWESTFWSDNRDLASTFSFGTEITVRVGPGIMEWNDAVSDGYQSLIRFDAKTNGNTGTVGGADLVSLCYKEVA